MGMVIAILHDGQSIIFIFGGSGRFSAGGAIMLKTELRVTLMTGNGNGLVGGLRHINLAL